LLVTNHLQLNTLWLLAVVVAVGMCPEDVDKAGALVVC